MTRRFYTPGAVVQSGTYGARPAAGAAGRYYWATDRRALYFDNGTDWEVASVPGAAKAYMSSVGYPTDGGPYHYAVGTNGATGASAYVQLGPVGAGVPAAALALPISLLYPVEIMYAGYAGTYAGPGTQYVGYNIRNSANASVLGVGVDTLDAISLSFGNFHFHRILRPAWLAAVGAAGTWSLQLCGAADGTRTAGMRNVTAIFRERPDLI